MSSSSSSSSGKGKSRFIPLDQIKDATDNFDDSYVLGQGGEATVYRAKIKLGWRITQVAVKHLKPNSQEYDNEIKIISKIQHPNLVSLLGYCDESGQKILVYEFMEKGSLADYLKKTSSICLSWLQRIRICLDAARGLQHLHLKTDEFSKGIIHRDVKPDNILLDKDWGAKISDFGMFKLSKAGQLKSTMMTLHRGTGGYLAPEYIMYYSVTRKIDVYAFGVVLFQVLCLKSPWDRGDVSFYPTDDEDVGAWAVENVDANIRAQISDESLKGFTAIIGKSLKKDHKKRPTMDGVVLELEKVLKCQERHVQHSTAGVRSGASETGADREYSYSYILDDVGEDMTLSLEEMEAFRRELEQAASYTEDSIYNDILNDTDRVVACLITMVIKASRSPQTSDVIAKYDYSLDTLKLIIQNKRLAHAVKESTLACVIIELLVLIKVIDEKVSRTDIDKVEGTESIVLTGLIEIILDNVERTRMFVILINLLRPLNPSLWTYQPSNLSSEESGKSFHLWVAQFSVNLMQNLLRELERTIKDVNPDPILQSIHLFMQQLGVDEIKRPKPDDDPSWIIVNYVLLELVKLRGTAITGHLSMVPIHMEPQPIILGYIDLHIQSVEKMKAFCHDSEDSIYNDILKDADRVVEGFTTTVAKAFDQSSLTGESLAICDYALNTLSQIFTYQRLVLVVKESTLEFLIKEIFIRRNDERLSLIDHGTIILKSLDDLIPMILDNVQRTSVFVVLINLLRPPSPTSNQSSEARSERFYDAVVEFLGKSIEDLEGTIEDLNLDPILQSIHLFMQELGMNEINRRSTAGDKPWRSVKNVLSKLVKLRGTAIRGHLSMVPVHMEPEPIILDYIDLYIQLGLD